MDNKVKIIRKGVQKAKEFRKGSGPISGVCGGISEYSGIPAIIVRIATVIGIFTSFGTVILIYLMLVIFLPRANKYNQNRHRENGGQVIQNLTNDIRCNNCHELNNYKRNYCQKCGHELFNQ
ncbi:MAG: PspC domain-containing protein [Bacteroidota bacterium]